MTPVGGTLLYLLAGELIPTLPPDGCDYDLPTNSPGQWRTDYPQPCKSALPQLYSLPPRCLPCCSHAIVKTLGTLPRIRVPPVGPLLDLPFAVVITIRVALLTGIVNIAGAIELIDYVYLRVDSCSRPDVTGDCLRYIAGLPITPGDPSAEPADWFARFPLITGCPRGRNLPQPQCYQPRPFWRGTVPLTQLHLLLYSVIPAFCTAHSRFWMDDWTALNLVLP